ncbi:MAG: porin family protein [Gemmatimonadota bacterium]
MRKFVALIATMFAFGLVGAQQAEAQQNMVGVKGGFIAAELSGDFADVESRTGFGFGGFLQVMVAPNFSIQPEALYLSKGTSEEGGDGEVKVNYLQVPVLVQYHLPTPGVSPRLFAGPSIAFETGCDFEEDGVSASCEDELISMKSADFGLVFGAGVDIPAGGVVVTFDGRYDMGVTNLSDEAEAVDFELKNRAWEFFAGVGFPFGP